MMGKILIIEDEESILMSLTDDLQLEGYQVTGVENGNNGLAKARQNNYDLIILDLMLPDIGGLEVCKQLRQANITTPILILTARNQEIDKVLGLELGADDYVTKPFSPMELKARIRAILRRTKATLPDIDSYAFDDIDIDFKKFEIRKNGHPIYLTCLEFALLHFFVRHKDEVLSRDRILDEIWGEDVYVTHRTVDTHVAHLRKKLEDNPANPRHILGVRGIGYKFVD